MAKASCQSAVRRSCRWLQFLDNKADVGEIFLRKQWFLSRVSFALKWRICFVYLPEKSDIAPQSVICNWASQLTFLETFLSSFSDHNAAFRRIFQGLRLGLGGITVIKERWGEKGLLNLVAAWGDRFFLYFTAYRFPHSVGLNGKIQ